MSGLTDAEREALDEGLRHARIPGQPARLHVAVERIVAAREQAAAERALRNTRDAWPVVLRKMWSGGEVRDWLSARFAALDAAPSQPEHVTTARSGLRECPACEALSQPETVTVRADDLSAVLNAVDYVTDRSLIGPVDRMGDALALVRLRNAAAPSQPAVEELAKIIEADPEGNTGTGLGEMLLMLAKRIDAIEARQLEHSSAEDQP